jgi:Protein of unknown function (DUF1569)
MKTVFDKATKEELIGRINSLNETCVPQWGKMNVYQMLKHCRLWEEMIAGKLACKRVFLGRVFGKMALKAFLKDERPMQKNAPSSRELIVNDSKGDMAAERATWIALMEENTHYSSPVFIHPFFGEMTKEQLGYLAYKHTDHHLRQFNR